MRNNRYMGFLGCMFFLFSIENGYTQGILFSQYRLIIKGKEVETLQVCNPSDEARSYQLSIEDKEMNNYGKVVALKDSLNCPWSLKKQIRIFPKRITLAAGECQTVQIQLKNTSLLSQGEFRSYLYFYPLTGKPTDISGIPLKSNEVRTSIAMRIGAAIPLIFRKSTKVEKVSIENVKINKKKDSTYSIEMEIHRNGTQSVYGSIFLTTQVNGETVILKELPGCAVFPEIEKRFVEINFASDKLKPDASGKIPFCIQYIDLEKGERKDVLAQWTGTF